MKNKKGFTLIELLAIIVILAIIAVITVPIILNIIENSRKGAAVDSAYGYKDAVHTAYVDKLATNNDLKLDGTYTVNNVGTLLPSDENTNFGDEEITSLPVSVSGTVPSSGSLTYEKNVLKSGYLVIGDYRVTFNEDGTVTTTKNTESSSNVSNNNQQQSVTPLAIGTDIDYSTTLNGATLNNWKVFLSDDNYTYLIYGDYLPAAAIDSNSLGINQFFSGPGVYSDVDRKTMIDAMTNPYWEDLLIGTLNETILIDETSNSNVWAMGAPTINLWTDSWNANSDYKILYTAQTSSAMNDGLNGYYVGDSPNPITTNINLGNETGFANRLYFPYNNDTNNVYGYWLSSPSASNNNNLVILYFSGYIYYESYNRHIDGVFAFRPVIKLPTSIVNQ